MLSRTIRILNFDDSLTKQKNLLEHFQPTIINLRHIGPLSRLWLNKETAGKIKNILKPEFKDSITFLGSGDFHHISALLIDQFQEDFCIIIFDLHPDLDNMPPRFSCGSWVNLVAVKKEVKKTVMIGPSSEDLSFPNNMTFNFSHFKDAHIELYPFYHAPSTIVFKNLRPNHFIHTNRSSILQRVSWENLHNKDIKQFTVDLIRRLPSRNIYISVDKDCLSWDYAITNWEPGVFSLDWLLFVLKVLKENTNIIGMDIVGDYSVIKTDTFFKNFCANWDHPRQLAKEVDLNKVNEINEATNFKILKLLLG